MSVSAKSIPTKINNYNVYNQEDGNKLLAIGDEMPLPDFEQATETVSGAGILGEFDDPTVGYFTNQELEVPWRLLDRTAIGMMNSTKSAKLEIRGAGQWLNAEGDIEFGPVRVVVRGRASSLTSGKLKRGAAMDAGVKLSLTYILIELDGETVLELDKLNPTFKVLGVDVLATINEMC